MFRWIIGLFLLMVFLHECEDGKYLDEIKNIVTVEINSGTYTDLLDDIRKMESSETVSEIDMHKRSAMNKIGRMSDNLKNKIIMEGNITTEPEEIDETADKEPEKEVKWNTF